MSDTTKIDVDVLKDMSYEEINKIINELNTNVETLEINNKILTEIVNSKNSISDEDVSELVNFINDELPHNGEWWSDGYTDFEVVAKDMLARGLDVDYIKSSFESMYSAVANEYAD